MFQSSLGNLALSASLLATPAFTSAATPTAETPVVTITARDVRFAPGAIEATSSPGLVPGTIDFKTSLLGAHSQDNVFCSDIVALRDAIMTATQPRKDALRQSLREVIDTQVENGALLAITGDHGPVTIGEGVERMKSVAAVDAVVATVKAAAHGAALCHR